MSQKNINKNSKEESQWEDNTINFALSQTDLRGANEKDQREMPALKTVPKTKITLGSCDQCFCRDQFQSQFNQQCPDNSAVRYLETDSDKSSKNPRKKFKEFFSHTKAYVDQPVSFSLKHGEKTCGKDDCKNSELSYKENEKRKLNDYSDYAVSDLNQPTDFSLKYDEEEIKNVFFGSQLESEVISNDKVAENYDYEDRTPLMFSPCSSLSSLSSFDYIIQSISDDRSSVESDFSRTTNGIVTPSELPDSPSQTAPSSPKRSKPAVYFPYKSDVSQ